MSLISPFRLPLTLVKMMQQVLEGTVSNLHLNLHLTSGEGAISEQWASNERAVAKSA